MIDVIDVTSNQLLCNFLIKFMCKGPVELNEVVWLRSMLNLWQILQDYSIA